MRMRSGRGSELQRLFLRHAADPKTNHPHDLKIVHIFGISIEKEHMNVTAEWTLKNLKW